MAKHSHPVPGAGCWEGVHLCWAVSQRPMPAALQASTKMVLNSSLLVGPFRASHLKLGEWVAAGYEPQATAQYLEVVRRVLSGRDIALDLRVPRAADIRWASCTCSEPCMGAGANQVECRMHTTLGPDAGTACCQQWQKRAHAAHSIAIHMCVVW
jgi:hypothetical protein